MWNMEQYDTSKQKCLDYFWPKIVQMSCGDVDFEKSRNQEKNQVATKRLINQAVAQEGFPGFDE